MKLLTTLLTTLSCLLVVDSVSLEAAKADQSFEDHFYREVNSSHSEIYTKTFNDPLHDFRLEIPEDWTIGEGFSNQKLDFVVIALSPEDRKEDAFIENMNVLVEDLGKPVTLEQYFMWNLVGLMQELPSFHVHEKGNVMVDGVKMAVVVYSWDLEKEKTATYQFIFVKDDKGYVITFSAEPEQFDEYRPTFDTIARSFSFND